MTMARSQHQGHVQAGPAARTRVGVADLVAARRSWQRDVVIARGVARVLNPESKLATTRGWKTPPGPD